MIIEKSVSIGKILSWTGGHVIWLLGGSAIIAAFYHYGHLEFELPWVAVSVIGTAVAFYVGFKNNQAYERMWEARKIWGGIVNESRTWGMMVDGYITNDFADEKASPEAIHSIKRRLIYRHIAWLYAHRSQLLVATPWEHVSQGGHIGRVAAMYQRKFGVGLVDDEVTRIELTHYLPQEEHDRLIEHSNTATQIINEQSRDLSELKTKGLLDDFRHTQMVSVLQQFYTLQGRNERIKKFPLPRQYANMSRYFVVIFLALLPFSLIPTLMGLSDWAVWLSIPITAVVGWVYLMMELVGDYSENPFQGMANDIPMLSLSRTIEIDLREMLGDENIPKPVKAVNGILM